ncbi:2-dehydro-3-deoxygalactonokinase [Dyella nitratireducens]|uniref:2-dehydro-3-deoxygalactonokinase n=1 Tax=Dyella nitratireducens TaxID=1849580 RepID=A0ABQ1FRC2_9GAMM|nr:2-dehydro-3-deoxygalactonokinase [Dyella nitratireducens]GGA25963.1 2-dehydro-3-deoxygalactonokinase [Dyella nitratireducens]GLQ43612.1 2-dehydro-3-deoxygalactonokinase [Dyella nitratireducens]
MSTDVQLIGLDWGTSSLRAYLYDADGKVVASRQQSWGIRNVPEGGFAGALQAITADWPACVAMAAGMIGSRQGWREVPYVALPADAASIAHGMLRVDGCGSHELWIAPGLQRRQPADVMRGEETQIIGALAQQPQHEVNMRFVLPGTHSKWATVVDGRITAFDTVMTGEIYALLIKHSILGAGLPSDPAQPFWAEAFVRGVLVARESGAEGIFSRLFSTRALMLAGELSPVHVPDFLSGLLIGEEFRLARLRDNGGVTPLCLIGDTSLCERYALAAQHFDYASPAVIDNAAAQGLWQLASAAGLLTKAKLHSFSGVTP